MNSTMKLFGFFFFALALSLMACKGEDGLMGVAGPAGVAGTDGVDGVDGRDGVDGTNGTDGQDGQDGNANVFTSAWASVDYTPTSGTFGAFNMDAPEITAEAMEEAVILGFLRNTAATSIYSIPKVWQNPSQILDARVNLGIYRFQYYASSTWTPPTVEGRYVVIPPAGRHAATENPKQAILDELSAEGVDLEDFDQVAKHFNIIE